MSGRAVLTGRVVDSTMVVDVVDVVDEEEGAWLVFA